MSPGSIARRRCPVFSGMRLRKGRVMGRRWTGHKEKAGRTRTRAEKFGFVLPRNIRRMKAGNVESVRVHPMERSARAAWVSSAWDRVAGGNAAAFFFAWLIGFAVLAVSLVILWASFNPGRPFELRFGF